MTDLYCGADLGRTEWPYTCLQRIGHDGTCVPTTPTRNAALIKLISERHGWTDFYTEAALNELRSGEDTERARSVAQDCSEILGRLTEAMTPVVEAVAATLRQLADAIQPFMESFAKTMDQGNYTLVPGAALTADEWNERYPVGTPVVAYPLTRPEDNVPSLCKRLDTKTRSKAWNLGHGAPVVKVEGYAGGIHLTHVDIKEKTDD